MVDSTISVSFSASVGDLVAGISQARDALDSLGAPAQQLAAQYSELREAMTQAFDATPLASYGSSLSEIAGLEKVVAAAADAAKSAGKNSDAYQQDTAEARAAIQEEIRLYRESLTQTMGILSEEKNLHQIGLDEKLNASRAALDEEYADEVSQLQRESQIGDLSLAQYQKLINQKAEADNRFKRQQMALTKESLDAQYEQYESFGSSITGAFNGQLRGLLSGTESWRTAFQKTLGDLLIEFIEFCEKSVVQYVAGEATKTAATTAGVAARTGAEQAGATASLAAQGASMIRSILSSAAEAFAGVFGFLAPVLGPAAAGPAAGAYGAVAGMAGAIASADVGMWQVPQDMLTLVHHNELIMPSAEAGAFRQMLSNEAPNSGGAVHIAPTTHLHVSAIDSGSVAQWMRSNSSTMVRAMDEAVRHGATLGAKRLRL